jgi:protein subunit release factor A
VATLGEWLTMQRDGMPATLWHQMEARVAACGQENADAFEGLQVATEVQVQQLRTLSCTDRNDAFDLLSTDAMVTYLLELAAANGGDDLEAFAGNVLRMVVGHHAQTGGDSVA